MQQRANVNAYTTLRNETAVASADPHRLIELLYDGALERIAQAKGAQMQGRIDIRGKKISHAINIVLGLRDSLNAEQGADIAHNLDALYDYIQRLLMEAHRTADMSKLDEAAELLSNMAGAWRQIAPARA